MTQIKIRFFLCSKGERKAFCQNEFSLYFTDRLFNCDKNKARKQENSLISPFSLLLLLSISIMPLNEDDDRMHMLTSSEDDHTR